MQHIDIADLLRGALLSRGCSREQVGDFDGHSPIELELNDLPNLNVEHIDEDIWLWSAVSQSSTSMLHHCAPDLLQLLLQHCDFARGGQMQIAEANNWLELRVMLSAQAVSSVEALADALDGFLENAQRLQGIVCQ
jgi:hypothetical protein